MSCAPARLGVSFDIGTEPATVDYVVKGANPSAAGTALQPCSLMRREMVNYFFHFDNGTAELDEDGTKLPNIAEARDQAVAMIAGILHNGEGVGIWAGMPLRVWVTDEPRGAGRTFFTLNVSVS
jgi:hypothetical protein